MLLVDNYGRRMDYLRLAVTDRCNLRCLYCMTSQGIELMERRNMLSWEEMEKVCTVFVRMGIRKLRITGGEPFARKGLIDFLRHIREKFPQLVTGITTNGTLLGEHLPELKRIGISKLNISLDTLNPSTFEKITRRGGILHILEAIELAHEMGFHLKINMVVLPNINDHELIDFAELTQDLDVTVRFIEPMPFNGCDESETNQFTCDQILKILQKQYRLHPVEKPGTGVDTQFRIPGYKGKTGIIAGYSRRFCDSCSRLRVSAQGQLRTCLYGVPVLDIREMIREGSRCKEIMESIQTVIQHRFENGVEAEKGRNSNRLDSMASIGG